MKPVQTRRGVRRFLANLVECRTSYLGIHMPSAAIQGGSAHSRIPGKPRRR